MLCAVYRYYTLRIQIIFLWFYDEIIYLSIDTFLALRCHRFIPCEAEDKQYTQAS